MGFISSVVQAIFVLGAFIFVLWLAYYGTRMISLLQYKKFQNFNIKVIETVPISQQKVLQLVKIADKILLIGLTKDNIVFLKEIDADSINIVDTLENNKIFESFETHLKKFMKK